MNSIRIFIIAALFLRSGSTPAQEADWDYWIESASELYDTGRELFDEHAPDEVKEWVEFPERRQWEAFLSLVDTTLESYSLYDLAWIRPEVETALKFLRTTPLGEPYADWLQERMDYFDMAEEVLQTYQQEYLPVRQPPPAPVPPMTPPRPPPPRRPPPPAVERQAYDAARDRAKWDAKIAKRQRPARADTLVPGLKKIFAEEGVPPEWVWLAEVESSMNPEARSPVGAKGLFQFMPATAERFGLKLSPSDERTHPEKSARAAAQYLRFLYGRFDSWPLALAAYNAGEGRVGRLLKSRNASTFEGIADALPAETQMYVPKVMATVALREGIDPAQLPPPTRRA